MPTSRWIDVSVPLRDGMLPWPGDPAFRLTRLFDLERGDVCTVSALSMSAHAGTHVDAPLHYLRRGRSVDRWPLDATVGPARVIQIRNPRVVDVDELRTHRIRQGERLLVKSRNSARKRPGTFFKDSFFSNALPVTIRFVKDETGKVTHLILLNNGREGGRARKID